MMLENWDGLLWLLLLLGPLLILQRNLHRNIQAVFLLVTRRPDLSLAMFSLLFFPGVAIHELSHYLAARILGVTTGRFSLLPRALPNGRLQLGFVETAKTDFIRDTLIGAAPLLVGGLFVTYAGLNRLGLDVVWDAVHSQNSANILTALKQISNQQDFWLWFYLLFTVSSTMLPSASDRRAWPSFGIVIVILLVMGLISGAGAWMMENLAPWFNSALRALDIVLVISSLFHLLLLPPVWVIRRLLEKLTGMQVT